MPMTTYVAAAPSGLARTATPAATIAVSFMAKGEAESSVGVFCGEERRSGGKRCAIA